MSLKLSNRLMTVISMVTPGHIVADVGTDHGYVPIYLVEEKIAPKAFAMDVNEGPLSIAKSHIEEIGLSAQIETRLSDGVRALKPQEADTVVIAGMGGMLIKKILEEGLETISMLKELVLSPQSDLREVRLFLKDNRISITKEKMIFEDGKYYWVLHCVPQTECVETDVPSIVSERFGTNLILNRDETLHRFLLEQERKYADILAQMEGRVSDEARMDANREELQAIREGLRFFDNERNH